MNRRGLGLALFAAAAMGAGFTHPFGNPRVEPARGFDTLLRGAAMPAGAKHVLISKCADCHSSETRWPVYARIAPGSWLIERDIQRAREAMNLSNWERMSADAQDVAIGKIIHEAKSGEMPPVQYRMLHWHAKLTAAEVAQLAMLDNRSSEQGGAGGAGDADRGRDVFTRRCTGCHAIEGNREGPQLAGVFGRRAGSVAGFNYSPGLKSSGIVWNEAALDRWLSDPEMVAPDTTMDFRVPKTQERADLIAYFRQISSGK